MLPGSGDIKVPHFSPDPLGESVLVEGEGGHCPSSDDTPNPLVFSLQKNAHHPTQSHGCKAGYRRCSKPHNIVPMEELTLSIATTTYIRTLRTSAWGVSWLAFQPELTALFSGLCDSVLAAQLKINAVAEYPPSGKMKQATYRPAGLNVAAAAANPIPETEKQPVRCQVRSWNLPEFHARAMLASPAQR
ncbi:hypothetical protein PG997_013403 [Apiospora hydei]|uniref:Uncharacterized protein n=1 Tax=Apiospora hydei TaxID=1337664 RepID=A0ABR1V622_9PEZI